MSSDKRRFKDAIYEQFSRIGKAVASPKRLELLELLCEGDRTVEVLAREAGLSVANASQHLQVLRGARLVEAEKRGLFVIYRVADTTVCEFLRAMRTLAEARLAEVTQISREFFRETGDLEPVDRQALLSRVRDGTASVLDVRPPEEYRAAHIEGAISVPLPELRRRLAELPREQEIVAYCRGPYCVLAVEAVKLLRAEGFRAVRLEDGVHDWQARGLPLAAGTADA